MESWNESKQAYLKDHLSKPLKAPNVRLNALNRIEQLVRENNAELLSGDTCFKKYKREEFSAYYEKIKGKSLNGAEKSVIHGLYEFSG